MSENGLFDGEKAGITALAFIRFLKCTKNMQGSAALKENPEAYWTYADYREWELAPGERYEIYREYWVIDPEHRGVHGCRFSGGETIVRSYGAAGTAPLELLNNLEIALEPVFAG
jgi:hypothetical protein